MQLSSGQAPSCGYPGAQRMGVLQGVQEAGGAGKIREATIVCSGPVAPERLARHGSRTSAAAVRRAPISTPAAGRRWLCCCHRTRRPAALRLFARVHANPACPHAGSRRSASPVHAGHRQAWVTIGAAAAFLEQSRIALAGPYRIAFGQDIADFLASRVVASTWGRLVRAVSRQKHTSRPPFPGDQRVEALGLPHARSSHVRGRPSVGDCPGRRRRRMGAGVRNIGGSLAAIGRGRPDPRAARPRSRVRHTPCWQVRPGCFDAPCSRHRRSPRDTGRCIAWSANAGGKPQNGHSEHRPATASGNCPGGL